MAAEDKRKPPEAEGKAKWMGAVRIEAEAQKQKQQSRRKKNKIAGH
jgi:hypothetical protein